ncbi:MAG: hypothetical protein CMN02_05335 [Roseibacillus sp.]|nr:hypothetical protein [Roseibacillus sp.]
MPLQRAVMTHPPKTARFVSLALLALCVGFVFQTFIPLSRGEEKQGEAPRRIEVLFLGSKNLFNHDPPARFRVLREALGPKAVNITYANNVEALTTENLAQYDVLLIFANLYELDVNTQGQALLDFARKGGGCVLLHCAAACFRDSDFPEYVDLLGAQFKSHGKGVFRARIVNQDHPVMKGWKGFECWDETYEHKRHGKDRIILQMRGDEPWSWVKTYGKGRVFYTASGHDHRCWNLPEYHDLIHRAIRWTAHDDKVSWLSPQQLPTLRYRRAAAPKDPKNPVGPLNQIQNPLSPSESLKLAQIPPGFELQLFAAEPQVVNPIAINWDHRGRLWVVEAFDYPHKVGSETPRDRIKILEDQNRDGVVDKVTVFAKGLNICTSVLPVSGGAIATDGADMVFLKDTDGDDRVDQREVLWTGIGLRDTHACVSNLRHGFDGWIYATVGYSGLDVTVGGKRYQSSQAAFRFLPDGSDFEIVQNTSNNTWGLGFTEEGDLVGSTANGNASWYLSIPNRHFARVGRKGQKVAQADDPEDLAPITSDYFQNNPKGQHSSAAGHAVYTSRRFPESWWNKRALVCEPPMHLVSAPQITRNGDRFQTTGFEHNLYASADAWSAPVSAEVGPDGAVWIADWYNPICNHNPYRDHFEKGEGNALRSADRDREHGRIYRIYPKDTPDESYPDLTTEHGALKALKHPNLFWRLTAQRILVQRLDSEALETATRETVSSRVRFHLMAASAHRKIDTIQVAAIAHRLRFDEEKIPQVQLSADPAHSEGLELLLERVCDPRRNPMDRKAAALRLVEADPDPQLGKNLLQLVLSDSSLARHQHLADAIRLAIIQHPEGFLRSFLEHKKKKKLGTLLGRIVENTLARVRQKPEVISDGLRIVALQSDSTFAKKLAKAAAAPPPTPSPTSLSPSAQRGQQAYLACVACHQPDGTGLPGAFPPLAGSKRLLGPVDLPARIILKGLQGPLKAGNKHYNGAMPGHERLLTDQQIADILNYTRTAWGNQAGEVTTEAVATIRSSIAQRTSPWTEPELSLEKDSTE